MYDIAIIGGGVVGALTARRLSAYKLTICVLEKENDAAAGVSKANSAIVHAGFDAEPGTLKARLNVRGSQLFKELASELNVKYRQNGSLVVGFNESDRLALGELYGRGIKNGVPGMELLDGKELRRREPAVSEAAVCALYAPSGAITCPYELTIAALGNAMDNGAEFIRNFEVKRICDAGEYFEISSPGKTVKARFLVNAAGLYSDSVAALAGAADFKIHPRRGEYMLLDKACGEIVSHTIFGVPQKSGKGVLVTPTVDGNILLGPTSEETDDKCDTSTTAEGLQKVRESASRLVKNIPFGKVITSFCGIRAAGDTGDFIINAPRRRFINAAGIESPGLSASPAIAEYIEGLLKKQGLKLEKNPDFNPARPSAHRFREASNEEKNWLIAKCPSYGKIICRCEGISEGEITDAIRTNPGARDLDGIKRRTRAQMGRCQGGFCTPSIMEILSRELGIPYEEITKSGEGSRLAAEVLK